MLRILGQKSSVHILEYFSFNSLKKGFHISFKSFPKQTIHINCQTYFPLVKQISNPDVLLQCLHSENERGVFDLAPNKHWHLQSGISPIACPCNINYGAFSSTLLEQKSKSLLYAWVGGCV